MITDNRVSDIAQAIFTSQSSITTGKVSYLRTLIEATQDELHNKKGEPATLQLAALKTTHARFYDIILKTAQGYVPKTQKDRSIALHARANFARTALSRVRMHIKAGEDIVALSAAKATAAGLSKPEQKARFISVKRLKARADTQSKSLLETLLGLSGADKAAGIDGIQLVISQLTSQMLSLGVVSTKNAVQATKEHRPLRVHKSLFMPTNVSPLLDGLAA